MLDTMDNSFLFLYSTGLIESGQLGDHKNPKVMLIISFFYVADVTLVKVICCINDLGQSVGWACLNAIVANWFGKRGRGKIIGFWQSC
jgi:OPA family glycerol-3-phosphate transporter-like MFS transporter 1/2